MKLYECLRDAGLPNGRLQLRRRPGRDSRRRAAGATTASMASSSPARSRSALISTRASRASSPSRSSSRWAARTRPSSAGHADLEEAAEGVMRAAFGFGGQKCSANSRCYVERPVYDDFLAQLAEKTQQHQDRRSARAPELARPGDQPARSGALRERPLPRPARGRPIAVGGDRLTDGDVRRGWYVHPTVATGLPTNHRLFREELFVPFLAVAPVDSIDEALTLANENDLRPDGGLLQRGQGEIDKFLDTIQAGVVYVNRRAGATTGAWPGIQPFGGWKASRLDRQGRRRPLLRPAVHARAEPDDRRLTRVPPRRAGRA